MRAKSLFDAQDSTRRLRPWRWAALVACLPALDLSAQRDELLERARSYLRRQHEVTGRFELAEVRTEFRDGIRALVVLALAHDAKARNIVVATCRSLLAIDAQSLEQAYARVHVALALTKVGTLPPKDDQEKGEFAAFAQRGHQLALACLDATDFENRETCARAIALTALANAKRSGVACDERRIEAELRKLVERATAAGALHASDFPSPSHGATALVCEALAAWERSAWPEHAKAIAWLEAQRLTEALSEQRAVVGRVYLRGLHLFELRAHCGALRASRRPSLDRTLALLTKHFATKVDERGGLASGYGPVYGTALLALMLAED